MFFILWALGLLAAVAATDFHYPDGNNGQQEEEHSVAGYEDRSSGSVETEYVYLDHKNEPICPSGGHPVCCTDGLEYFYFENSCHMQKHNLRELFEGRRGKSRSA